MPTSPFSATFRITSPYGYRTDPITGQAGAWHGGLDLVCDDTAVRAICAGQVAVSQIVTDRSNATWQWGNYVCILGDDGNYVYYCHLADRAVRTGERVRAGQTVGTMGATGRVTGPHLHLEVRSSANRQLDTAAYLGIRNEVGTVALAPAASSAGHDDVPADWSREAVGWATARGILCGDIEGHLHLREPCTREMAITFLYRAVGGGR